MEYLDLNEKSTTAWTDIYKPKKINDIVGNKKAISGIVNWLNSFESNKKKILAERKQKLAGKSNKKKKIKINIKVDDSTEETTNEIIEQDTIKLEDIENDLNNLDDETDVEKEDKENEDKVVTKISKKDDVPHSCLLVTGSHGIGKTSSVHTILQELGYSIQVINFNKIKTAKNIKEVLDVMGNDYNIITLYMNNSPIKGAIVIDEIESLTSKTEKICISTILKNNEMHWIQPVIFISNNKHSKILTEIKKNSDEIKMWQPFPNEIQYLMKSICDKAHINIESQTVANKIVEHCQKDLRRLVFILQDLKNILSMKKSQKKTDKNPNTVSNEIIDEYCVNSQKKDMDNDLYKVSGNLINEYHGIDECLKYYETDKVVVPLMIQQNYIKNINLFSNNGNNNIGLSYHISRLLSKGDVIENYIYGNQNWDLQEVHGYYSCVAPSYYLDDNLCSLRNERLDYPADLNKTSIMKINRGTIEKAKKGLKNMNIHDYIYLNYIVRNYINKGKINKCLDLFEGYNISLENIESLIKVDKIKNTKTNLTSKQKKEITGILQKSNTL